MREYRSLIFRPRGALAEIVAHLDAGGNPRARNNTALRWACSYGNLALLERLLTGHPGVPGYPGLTADDARTFENEALRLACMFGYLDILERLLELGLTADDARACDNEALRSACDCNYPVVVARLLELGIEPTSESLVRLSQQYDNYEWTQRLWRAVERWEGSPELQVVESKLTPLQLEAWETAKVRACPRGLRFVD